MTTDIVIFAIRGDSLEVLLIQRGNPPFQGRWALPGGLVEPGEDLETCARRELEEETGVSGLALEQLHTFGSPHRDPRGRVVTVAYSTLIEADRLQAPRAGSDAASVRWFDVDSLPALAFDHGEIIALALRRLGRKPKLALGNAGRRVVVVRSRRKLELNEYGDGAGHPVFFFHGLIGSHHQASYVAEQARSSGLRLLAINRPGVGGSEFVTRASPLDAVDDVEDVAGHLELDDFSLIGISGGAPYALAALHRLGRRVRTVTVLSGMGPVQTPRGLRGMDYRRRLFLGAGSRYPQLARQAFQTAGDRFRASPERFLDRLIATWSPPDRALFQRRTVYDLFLKDLHAVFTEGVGPAGLAQEIRLFRHYGFPLSALPADHRVTLWHGLSDTIVPPAMAWELVRALPNAEAHFVPGGHFMAIDAADLIIARLRQQLGGA
jgi:ADP-ribose pyrophosphatase YjhB (NUDIX family)/predicted esterase